jgi:hypothetical protein
MEWVAPRERGAGRVRHLAQVSYEIAFLGLFLPKSGVFLL